MKISRSIREAYKRSKEDYQRLSEEVRAKLQPKVETNNWFFIHRLKEQESFALKIETGRVDDPLRMEDFFACTIVVPTVLQIPDAEEILEDFYEIETRRPSSDGITHKRASDFVFDDLRLYLKLGLSETGKNEDLKGLVFEVQIKTILQYAWGIAAHDLIYKTDKVSWPKERIAFQVKAMLEHAEIAIAGAEQLADSPAISKKNSDTDSTLEVIDVLGKFFIGDRLPGDIKRLAETIRNILKTCSIEPSSLVDILNAERKRIGLIPVNISPYAFFVQALAHSTKFDFQAKILSSKNRKTKLLVHSDMDLPSWMNTENEKIIRL